MTESVRKRMKGLELRRHGRVECVGFVRDWEDGGGRVDTPYPLCVTERVRNAVIKKELEEILFLRECASG